MHRFSPGRPVRSAHGPRRPLALLASFLLVASGCGGAGGSGQHLVTIGAGLAGPPGTRATVYATGPRNVAALAFDPQGRLWLATAAFQDQGDDAVYVVARPGAPAQRVLTGQHTPLGLLWADGRLLVAGRGGVAAYDGFDGERFGSQRQLVSLPDDIGEVNGLALGPDGRARLGVSAPCDHCDNPPDRSAAVLAFSTDGSDLTVEASGIRAPIGLAYHDGRLFVTMNHRDDLGAATPGDWLAVVSPGDAWGFPACYGQGGPACAGVPAPVATLDPHAAVSGLAFPGGALAAKLGDVAIVAEWAKGRVVQVALRAAPASRGGSVGTVTTLLTGIDQPEPVVTTPRGSVLVGDWASGRVFEIDAG